MRWVVGDIHGCAAEFEQLLRAIDFDAARDELWSAGDLVNKGPSSLAVLRLWIETGARGVLGNHDIYALRSYAGCRPRHNDSLDELFSAPDVDELLAAMRRLPLLVHLPPIANAPGAWLVHAGLHPDWLQLQDIAVDINPAPHDDDWLQAPSTTFATKVRGCTAAGEISKDFGPPEACKAPFKPWDQFYRGSDRVVHGHWAMRGYHRTGPVIGVDSGCVYGGKLTAWCQDDDRVVQV